MHWEEGDQTFSCQVTNHTDHLNEANLLVLKSKMESAGADAGLGLFLMTTPLDHMPKIIRKRRNNTCTGTTLFLSYRRIKFHLNRSRFPILIDLHQ